MYLVARLCSKKPWRCPVTKFVTIGIDFCFTFIFELRTATVYVRVVLSSFKVDVNAKRDVREPMKSAVNLCLPTQPLWSAAIQEKLVFWRNNETDIFGIRERHSSSGDLAQKRELALHCECSRRAWLWRLMGGKFDLNLDLTVPPTTSPLPLLKLVCTCNQVNHAPHCWDLLLLFTNLFGVMFHEQSSRPSTSPCLSQASTESPKHNSPSHPALLFYFLLRIAHSESYLISGESLRICTPGRKI
jgi:hypothetical protein